MHLCQLGPVHIIMHAKYSITYLRHRVESLIHVDFTPLHRPQLWIRFNDGEISYVHPARGRNELHRVTYYTS